MESASSIGVRVFVRVGLGLGCVFLANGCWKFDMVGEVVISSGDRELGSVRVSFRSRWRQVGSLGNLGQR
jgi:hypothetical protein